MRRDYQIRFGYEPTVKLNVNWVPYGNTGRLLCVDTGINNAGALKDLGCNSIDCVRLDVSNYGRLVADIQQ